MSYEEVINYLYTATPVFEHTGASAYKPGLQTTEALDEHYGHPHHQYKTIHVAGTNGKGSVSHSLASILQEAGYHVGLYTSPHIVDFRERIRVNGECIPEQYVIDFVEGFIRWNTPTLNTQHLTFNTQHSTLNTQYSPSFFELTTALAFKYFADAKVDIAVIEVGLGGRLDCTNIITPVLSVITNIAFDHTQFLGNNLAAIASEKAGIIKPHVPVVIGETTPETRPVFEQKASEAGAPIFFAEEYQMSSPLPDFELKGSYQEKNLRTILCAASHLLSLLSPLTSHLSESSIVNCPLDPKEYFQSEAGKELSIGNALQHVVENTGLMGRWQTLQEKPLVICDTGHNPAAWQYLAPQIQSVPCRQLRIVFGMVDDKDIDTVLAMLPQQARYYFTQADNHRAIPATHIADLAQRQHLIGEAYGTVADAYQATLSEATPDDFIFIGGSSYVVADLLTSLQASH